MPKGCGGNSDVNLIYEIMQGDECYIPLEISDENGNIATRDTFEDIEITIGSIRKTLKEGQIEYDDENHFFLFHLTQEETFKKLKASKERVQVRVKTLKGDVIGTDAGEYRVKASQSRAIL